jgi:4-hydroxybenzoate polyprenyltransferase
MGPGGQVAGPLDWRRRAAAYWRLVRADRPIGIYLLLWPTLWGLWFAAEGIPPAWILVVFVLGTVLMRSAGCAINDFADRNFDAHVERTAQRPLATGEVSAREALVVFASLSLVAFGLVLTLDRQTVALSFVAVLLAALYPFTKRYTHMPQLVLGVAFAWAIPMAFSAVRGDLPGLAWLLFAATVTWALVYDTLYAMVDREDDLRIGVKSTAILFGRFDRLAIGLLQLLMLALLVAAGVAAGRGPWFAVGILVAAALFAHQQYRVRERDRAACFQAFLNNHYVGLAVFAGLFLDYLDGA